MYRTHKIALDPTVAQVCYFAKAAGTARFAWNWALAEWKRQYEAGEKPNWIALHRQLTSIKHTDYPWMADVLKYAPQQAIMNLGKAFDRFFKTKSNYPKFKKKGVARDSFRADNGALIVVGKIVKLPRIGTVRIREELRFQGIIKSAIISRTADRWLIAICVKIEKNILPRENQAVAGVDLGISHMATISDGSVYANPKILQRRLATLRRRSRDISRKHRGSANRKKAVRRLARLHTRIANIRKDALHKATTDIVRRFSIIGIEDLNVVGMLNNAKLARAVADVGFYEFRRQIEYKAILFNSRVVVVNRWFPSSKMCSSCGKIIEKLPLNARNWTCRNCGIFHDRDLNAAINLKHAASSAVLACGETSSDIMARSFMSMRLDEARTNAEISIQNMKFHQTLENGTSCAARATVRPSRERRISCRTT